jgi:hypothetical protein
MDLRKDIYFYADLASFPAIGAANLLYVDSATSLIYIWNGASYVASGAGGLKYGGLWNAATNNPTITSGVGDTGEYYIVGTAGTTSIDGINDWAIGDWIIFGGSAWQKIDNSDKEGYNTIEDEGTPLTQRSTINFVGSGVTAADSGGKTVVTIASGGLTEFTEAENTAAPNATVPVNSLTPVTATTDADVAFVPKGAGALLASVPNNLTSGGNKRGQYAVDWQLLRNANTQVASGNRSVILGGFNNRSAADYSITGGESNNVTGTHSVALGSGNGISGIASIALGASNTVSSDQSGAIGTTNNIGSGRNYAFAAGGINTISTAGQYQTALGYFNTVSNNVSVGIGFQNTSSGSAAVALGQQNTASGQNATAIGRSNIASAGDAVSIGTLNSNSGYGSQVLGFQMTVSGTYATGIGNGSTVGGARAISFGYANSANGESSVNIGNVNTTSAQASRAFGQSNIASAIHSTAIGSGNTASGEYSLALGASSSTHGIYGRQTYASGQEGTAGDSQASKFVLHERTTDATPTTITTNSSAAGTTNQVILSNQSAYRFKGSIVGKQSGSTNASVWDVDGFLVRGANAAATTLNVSNVTLVENTPAWGTPTLAADTTNGGLQVQVIGAAATNIQWTAVIETTEVIYA